MGYQLVAAAMLTACLAWSQEKIFWRDPGKVEALDLAGGPGGHSGAPKPPFVFNEEEGGGTSPKLMVTDANKRRWSVKFGPEVHSEVFATRLLSAAGYMTDTDYFVASGEIDSVGALGRAAANINRSAGNRFGPARFELREDDVHPLPGNWSFVDNPFIGRPEFQGLKIMMMLLSNWDVKDSRSHDGPNTTILGVYKGSKVVEQRYLITDWGATMGKWGNVATRSKWDCEGYAKQTPQFVKGVLYGKVGFGFEGKRREDVAEGISVDDVRWLMQYLGRITDDQIRAALTASGANQRETDCFARAVRDRIEQLRRLTKSTEVSQ
jgi:hypothetical protein